MDPNIVSLDLSGQELTELPKWIGNLQKLEKLDVSVNKLSDLTEELWSLRNLKTLDVTGNQLSKISDKIGDLASLEILRLSKRGISGNKFGNIPESIGSLQNLQEIYIDGHDNYGCVGGWNQWSGRCRRWGDRGCDESVGAVGQEITILPESIGNLKELRVLSMRCGGLRRIPDSIGALSNLKSLNVRNNDLYNLPASITQLSKLTDLDFDGNIFEFADLPVDMQLFINRCCR